MITPLHIGIVGATGAVGQTLLELIEKRKFPIASLHLFSRSMSRPISPDAFEGLDLVFFCAGRAVSREFVPHALQSGALVIDSSSEFRLDPKVPLVIPEINAASNQLIASPNCSATIMLMALAPLHRHFRIKRISAATYQAVSGAGKRAMKDLEEETKAFLEGHPSRYAFNLYLHNSPMGPNGYNEEEMKMAEESRKILNDPSIQITATCVRVPVLRAHSEALNVSFHEPIDPESARQILRTAPGVVLMDSPTPFDATGRDEVLCGRIRKDLSQENGLDLWVVGDQLLKGAALNALQIAEHHFELSVCQ